MKNKLLIVPLLFSVFNYSNAQNITRSVSVPNNANVIQIVSPNESNNKVNLNVIGKQEIEQDYLSITLSYTIQNQNPKIVQENLNKEISAALKQAKANQDSLGKKLTVRSGQFSVYPKYEKQQLVNWVGQGTIILEGTDFALVGSTASQLNRLVISNISLGLSPEKVDSLKDSTVKQAINNFKIESQKITELFGFKNYKIKEISVNYNNPVMPYRPNMAMMAKSVESAPAAITVEPGKTMLEANVSGSIEMFN